EAFNDESLRNKINLSSANSINIARLIPQSFYYIYAYSKLKELNKDIVFSIPSGNFGNLTAGLFAKEMGIPKIKFIAATNANSVVPEYLNGAEYNPRASIQTISNAMDVGNPSNFTRIQDLYRTKEEIQSRVVGYSINEEDTKDTMLNIYNQYKYISCPHTAVGIKAFENYKLTHKESVGVCLATAHPAKFKDTVEEVLNVNIEIPKRLKDCLSKKKNALSISSDYEKFKQFLISSSSI
ncbi:UNVERIFIED_CONTAM: hypothetical protein GTU68_044454, partial [Idotea baltica]|nr:hypothetical protein [Idotea baltica]